MNVHFSYKLHKTPAIEKKVTVLVAKLGKRLQVFRPGLVHLKGIVEEISPREGISVSLNLRLPSGQMAAKESAERPTAAIKRAFDELLQQVSKHKDRLRHSNTWPRWRHGSEGLERSVVPFETTLAAVPLPLVSTEDVREYVNANLARLEKMVVREISLHESNEQLSHGAVSKEEVIDELVALALEEQISKPERLGLEGWLHRLAVRAIQSFAVLRDEERIEVHLEESVRPRNIRASDEPELQFHQPDETFTEETVIADRRVSTPEDITYSDELLSLVHSALAAATPREREAFVLHVIEGFSVDEIAALMNLRVDEIIFSIAAAREHLLGVSGPQKTHPSVAAS